MSSISRLSLSRAGDEDNLVHGWDETIDDRQKWQKSSFRASISSHAMAHNTIVCGTVTSAGDEWITWKTSFAPHQVCRVACNSNGSIIAVTMDNGTVSILRGRDGVILATRRVAVEGVRIPAEISFVSDDTLLVEPPDDSSMILVSAIDGERLNSTHQGVVSEAARSMAIHSVKFPGSDDVRAIRGSYISETTIRFALVDGNGKLAIYDYSTLQKDSTLVKNDVSVVNHEKTWEIDFDVGFRLQFSGRNKPCLVMSASFETTTRIVWFDVQELTPLADYILSKDGVQSPRLMALEPLKSSPGSVAVAIAFKYGKDSPNIETRVVQAALLDSGVIGTPHEVFTIPVPSSIKSLSIAPLESTDGLYSFRCKTWMGDQNHDCYIFRTANNYHHDSPIAKIRLLAMCEKYDKALKIVEELGARSLIGDVFARFHPAEIALRRLLRVLSVGGISTEKAAKESREYIKQLVFAAHSGNEYGQRALLSAADGILEWPDDKAMKNPPTIAEVMMALQGFLSAMSSVSGMFKGKLLASFDSTVKKLEERFKAMQYFGAIVGQNKLVKLNDKFARVRSSEELFACLIQNGHFVAAEHMWKSQLRDSLTTESMVTAVLRIEANVDPRRYSTLLEEIVFPSLAINHELLPSLLAWSCKTADAFDDTDNNKYGLDEAIYLLEISERATKHLRVRIHGSFALYAPFVEKNGTKRRKVSPRNASVDESTASAFSFSNSNSAQNCSIGAARHETRRPNPTILELSRMKGGAQLARLGQMTSLRVDAVDESEEIVEAKLSSARCLKRARALGLDQNLVRLRSFAMSGGAQYISKELVRLFSSSSKTHEERFKHLATNGKQFCFDSSTDFDEAIAEYAHELCGDKNTTKKAIEESASLARCCLASETRCRVTLVSLRAALFCRFSPAWLSKLSQEAIQWAAGDSSLRSELEEASRLLLIDGIVGRYCGEGAKELFHVDNPRHAIRLLDYMSIHFDSESVLSDTLDLCDAFAHLSKEDACSRIIQNAILAGREKSCETLLQSLYRKNVILARAAFSRVISFCIDIIEGGPTGIIKGNTGEANHISGRQQETMLATKCAYALSKIALSNHQSNAMVPKGGFSSIHLDEEQLERMIEGFQRLNILQRDHRIFLSMADLRDSKKLVEIATELMTPLASSYVVGECEDSSAVVTQIKRTCSLLAGYSEVDGEDLWHAAVGASACQLAMKATGLECIRFLTDLGVFESSMNELAARSFLALALSLCKKVSRNTESHGIETGMKYVLMASSILYDHALQLSPANLLESTVSLGELCDVISHVLQRSDEGIGEVLDEFRRNLHRTAGLKGSPLCGATNDKGREEAKYLRLRQPTIHSSWYIGDGLLLPPLETLVRGVEYCKHTVATSAAGETIFKLITFVEARGAHALSLRLLIMSISKQLCNPSTASPSALSSLTDANLKTLTALSERYLGGTGNGITSGVIDSQLAVSFLLSLPLRTAFKIFKSTLPTAISTRDFKRVGTLAGIGKVAGSGDLFKANGIQAVHLWKKQSKFVLQCELLSLRAKWWNILQVYNVRFDPGRFEDGGQRALVKEGNQSNSSNYIASLTSTLIANMSKVVYDTEAILRTAFDFLVSFGLNGDIAVQKYVEFLLSPLEPEHMDQKRKRGPKTENLRMKLSNVESLVKRLIRRLDPPIKKVMVLRECLIRLEASNSSKDYERISIVLALYHSELSSLLNGDVKQGNFDSKMLYSELELVDRRRDALAILSSYFQGENGKDRPSFSAFFIPMATREGSNIQMKTSREILGLECNNDCKNNFDPLEPLEKVLQKSCSSAVMSALAPLCLPLGVPRGYIHARALIGRFRKSMHEKSALPSFDLDVLPVLNRLSSSADVADLAEWCSLQYRFENEDKLKSLNHALNFAIRASDEIERHAGKGRSGDSRAHESEPKALERVKRITASKDMLSDRLAINAILHSVGITTEKACTLSVVVGKLMERLENEVWSKTEFSPEYFVEVFLRESSLLAAEASLSNEMALSIGQFRQLSLLVHRACKSVADKYSHVQVGDIARNFVDKFLFYGDNEHSDEENTTIPEVNTSLDVLKPPVVRPLVDIDEEDTMNFIMDLSSLRETDDGWSSEAVGGGADNQYGPKLTSEEESSSLNLSGSAREASEHAGQRVSLRIAFVMAYADGYHAKDTENSFKNDENSKPAGNAKFSGMKGTKRQTRTLLGKLSTRGTKERDNSVLAHSRELLRIVFAKSSREGLVAKDVNTTNTDPTNRISSRRGTGKTVTFAMRHRALRASSVLCPQDALEEVVEEEKLMDPGCSLKKCSFGVFVAKEIEEMGLSLPHSDLTQLSTMHFPSYARTLWRHHRNGRNPKGRLLLLILEMYLKESVSDYNFVLSILTEMLNLNLPRTLLLALESICEYLERAGQTEMIAFANATSTGVNNAIDSLSRMILSEMKKVCSISGKSEEELTAGFKTLGRLGFVIQSFAGSCGLQENLLQFTDDLLNLVSTAQTDCQKFGASDILGHALQRIAKKNFDARFKERVMRLVSDKRLNTNALSATTAQDSPEGENASEDPLVRALRLFECSLDKSVGIEKIR